MTLFYILYTIDVIVAVIAVYYFFIGLADGSVSSFNGGIWFALLAALAALLIGTFFLKSAGKIALANTLLAVLAVPAVLFAFFMLTVIVTKQKWN